MFTIVDDIIDSGRPLATGLVVRARAEAEKASKLDAQAEAARLPQMLDAALSFCSVSIDDLLRGAGSSAPPALFDQIETEALKQRNEGIAGFADALRALGAALASSCGAAFDDVEKLRSAVRKARHQTGNREVQRWLDAALHPGARVIFNERCVVY